MGNQLRIGNYELTIIHQASQNQAHQAHLINHSSDKIMVQTKPCYKHGSRTSSLQTRMRGVINYELPTHQASQNPENPEILKILIQTIIHQASQNPENPEILIQTINKSG